MKKNILLFFMTFVTHGMITAALPTQIGGIMRKNVPLYVQHNGGTIDLTSTQPFTFDFKLVTIDSKSYAWLKTSNGSMPGNADWEAQLRYYSSIQQKTENNLTVKNSTTKEVTGSTSATMPSPLSISFFMNIGGFIESDLISYNPNDFSNANGSSSTTPIINSITINPTEVSAHFTITSNVPDSEVFYYIEDDTKGISTVSLSSEYTLAGLTANTTYNFTITPIDFYGNVGTSTTQRVTTKGMVNIISGMAKEIRFTLKSTATELECYIEPINPNRKLHSAALQVTPAGGSQFELTNPSVEISQDGTYGYIRSTDVRLANQTLAINIPYLLLLENGDFPGWEAYVMNNNTITEGTHIGLPIMHGMGLNTTSNDITNPILSSATLAEQGLDYIVINLQGSDDSGIVYYEISGGKETVHAFKTGNYYFKAFEQGKSYTLHVTAKDLSGNTSTTSEEIKFKSYARSNIFDGDNLNYNSTTKLTGEGGELGTLINFDGTTLTLGCTTQNTKLGTAKDRTFWSDKKPAFAPTVKINGKSYSLTTSTNDETTTSATIALSGNLDGTPITAGTILHVQWNVFWSNNSGNFFTGTFLYKLGDYGQEDTCKPSTPILSLSNNVISWEACTDAITSVSKYEVYTDGSLATTIQDHGEESFQYPIPNNVQLVKIVAYDMTGNASEATINLISTDLNRPSNLITVSCKQGTLYVTGVEVKQLSLYSLSGQLIDQTESNTLSYANTKLTLAIALIKTSDGGRHAIKVSLQ